MWLFELQVSARGATLLFSSVHRSDNNRSVLLNRKGVLTECFRSGPLQSNLVDWLQPLCSGIPGVSSRRRDGSRLHAATSRAVEYAIYRSDSRRCRLQERSLCTRQRNDRRDRCRTIETLVRPLQGTLHNTTEQSAQIESSPHHKKAYYCQVAFIVFVEHR